MRTVWRDYTVLEPVKSHMTFAYATHFTANRSAERMLPASSAICTRGTSAAKVFTLAFARLPVKHTDAVSLSTGTR